MATTPPPQYSLHQLITPPHTRSISALKFNTTGSLFASASADGTVKMYKHDTTQPSGHTYTQSGIFDNLHDLGINDIAFDHHSTYLATAPDDKHIGIWSVETQQPLRLLKGHTNNVMCVQFNQSSTLLISGGYDETVRIWDLKSGKCIRSLLAHTDPISSIDVSADGNYIVSGAYDGLVRIWDMSLGQCIKTIFHDKTPPISAVKFSPNSKFVLSSCLSSELRLWEYETGRCLKQYNQHVNTKYCCFSSFSTTGPSKLVVTGTDAGVVCLYDLQSRQLAQKLTHRGSMKQDENGVVEESKTNEVSTVTPVIAVATHPTESVILTGGTEPNHSINVWTCAGSKSEQAMDTS